MAEKSGPVFEGAVGLFPGTRQDNIPVLAIKPLSFELPAADSRVQAEHGTKGCEIAKKRKSAYLAYQQQRMDKISEQKSRSTSRESTARALEHERGNGAEEQRVHDRKGKGFYGGESEKIKWILSKYRSLLRRMAQQQEVVEPQDAPKTAPLHVEAANRLKPHWQKCAKKRIGPVPGVEVGDEFQYRIEMHIIGLHGPLQSGIDFLRAENSSQRVSLATSIVVSGGYEDDIDNGDVLIYTGQGANDYVGNRKQIDDQKLTAENTALLNSWKFKRPVRVIRGFKFSKKLPRGNFRYDGLYNVEHCWHEKGCSGYLVYKFKLRRQRGQAPLAFHAVRFTGKSGNPNARQENVIKEDIGEGLDKSRISVVNAVDGVCSLDDFKYLVRVKYPDWLGKLCLSEGCRCVGGCNDVKNCLCARRNGGEFPYTRKGMLVRAKPGVYECGPSCRCPPTCANRVAQHGMKPRLEIFRTQSRNWGVRSLDFIEAGGFIVEYTDCGGCGFQGGCIKKWKCEQIHR